MKKILVAICAMVLSAPAFAQYSSGGFTLDEENVYWGVRIGLSNAHMAGTHGFSLDSRAGLNLGGVVGLRCSNSVPVFLESGLYYSEKGGKSTLTKSRLSYVEIPVLIKYGVKLSETTPGLKDMAVIPFFGPTFAFGVGGKTEVEGMTQAGVEKWDSFSSRRYSRFDMGLKTGVGIEYNMIYLELGYQWGLTNISQNDGFDAYNRAFFLNFGVNF